MDKLKLSQLGERLKTGGAQMGRLVSEKMKEILQNPTPESKMVDEATSETLKEPNWGMNLRICAMINSEEFSGSEIVRTIKKKFMGKSVVSQSLSLDLLETCTMNCEKLFSEVASEKVLDEMVRMIDNPQTDQGNRVRALQLIRAWGESEDLAYLPIFHQTYTNLRRRAASSPDQEGAFAVGQHSLETYVHQQPLSPPERYPVPTFGIPDSDQVATHLNYRSLSVEEKKEFLAIARNSHELLSSMLNTEIEPKHLKEDLTVSILEKCKESLPVIRTIVEGTTDDEGILFEALYLYDELRQVISKYEELEAGLKSEPRQAEKSEAIKKLETAENPEPLKKLEAAEHREAMKKKLEAAESPEAMKEKFEAAENPGGDLHESIKSTGNKNLGVGKSSVEKLPGISDAGDSNTPQALGNS